MKLYDSGTELLIIRTMVEEPNSGAVIMSQLGSDYFGWDVSKEIYNRIRVLIEAGKSIPSLGLLKNDPILSEEAKAALSSDIEPLREDDYDSAYKSLENYRKARLIIENIQTTTDELSEDHPNIDNVLSSMESMIARCRSGMVTDEMFHIMDTNPDIFLNAVEEDLEADEGQFIQSGFREFDKRTGGFRRGQVLVLAAPSGCGKSAMMGQMAMLQYMMGFNVCVISFEMTNEDLRMRMLSNISKLNHADIHIRRLIEEQKELVRNRSKEFVSTGMGNRLTLWGTSEELDVKDISARVKPYNFDVVYIDYVGLLKEPKGDNQQKVLGDHVRDCKLTAKGNDCLMVPLVQLDDESFKIKYSKAIKANSDFIWAWEIDPKQQEAGIVQIVQQKARSASTYDFYLACDFTRMAFEDYSGVPPEVATKPEESKDTPALPKMGIAN